MVKYNNEWFLNKVKEKRPHDYMEYEFLESYKKSREKIKAVHIPCGREIYIIPNTFLSRGHGCKKCRMGSVHRNQTKKHTDFEKELPEGVIALEKYKGAHSYIKVHCFFCDSTYDVRAREIVKQGCTRCPGRRYKRNIEDIKKEVRENTNGHYIGISEDYKNTHTKISIKHKDCGTIYDVSMANFRYRNRRCPYCSSSVGEKLVEMFLEKNNIGFLKQKKYSDLKYKNHLSYDFFLPKHNILIEYQGEQHRKPVKIFGGEKQLKLQCKLDNMKRKYARDNGYKLIEVPYNIRTYKDIDEYLKPHLIYS